MRRWLLPLMIVLLLLRGWVGEAMAGQMLQQRLAPAAITASADLAHEDCAGHHEAQEEAAPAAAHHEAQDDAAPAAAHPEAGGCPTCASCQACSGVALGTPSATPGVLPLAQPAPATQESRHPSADPGAAFKPPIS